MPLAPQLSVPHLGPLPSTTTTTTTSTKIRNNHNKKTFKMMKASKPKLSFSIDAIVGKRKTLDQSSSTAKSSKLNKTTIKQASTQMNNTNNDDESSNDTISNETSSSSSSSSTLSSSLETRPLKRPSCETFNHSIKMNNDDQCCNSPNLNDQNENKRSSPSNDVIGGRQSISPPLSNGTTSMPPDVGSPGRSLSPLSLVTNQSLISNTQPPSSLANMAQFLAANRQSFMTTGNASIMPSVSTPTPPPSSSLTRSTSPTHRSSSSPMSPAQLSLPFASNPTITSSAATTTATTQQPQISSIAHQNHSMMVAAAAAAAAAAQLPTPRTTASTGVPPSNPLPSDYQHAAAFYPWFLRANPFAGRFPGMPFDTPLGSFLLPPFRKPKRIRTAFSPGQLLKLEQAFEKNHYVVGNERKQLANHLGLSETQVKVWFQNRRTKHKRQKQEDEESGGSGSNGNQSNGANNSAKMDFNSDDDEEIDLEDEECGSGDDQDVNAAHHLLNHPHLNHLHASSTSTSAAAAAAAAAAQQHALKFANMHHLWYQSAMGLMTAANSNSATNGQDTNGHRPPVTTSESN